MPVRHFVTSLLLITVLAVSIYFVVGNADEVLELMGRIDPWILLLVALLRVFSLALTVKAALVLIADQAPRLGFTEYFAVSTMGQFAGYVSPGGATLSKAVYLKQRHNLGYVAFTGFQMSWLISILGASSLVGSLGLCLLMLQGWDNLGLLWLLAALGVTLNLTPLLVGARVSRLIVRFLPRFAPLFEVWQTRRHAWSMMFRIWPILLLHGANEFLAMGLLFAAFAVGGNAFLVGGTLEGLTSVFNVLRVTPGNLGLYEWAVTLLGHHLGVTIAGAFIATLSFRLLGMTSTGLVSLLVLLYRFARGQPVPRRSEDQVPANRTSETES